jgi:hypothetical protein
MFECLLDLDHPVKFPVELENRLQVVRLKRVSDGASTALIPRCVLFPAGI